MSPNDKICEKCHEHKATVHITHIVNEVTKTSELCDECFEASSPEGKEFASAMRDARCKYCDGQPCAGDTDFMDVIAGVQKINFMCMPCRMEHSRYMQQGLAQMPENLSQMEQLTALGKLRQQVDKHMKQWISQK